MWICLLSCYISLEWALAPLSPGRPRQKLTTFFRRALLQPVQGIPVRSIFYNFDAFATIKHHKIDLNWYQNDISVKITTGAAAKSHCKEPQYLKKKTNFLILKLNNDMREWICVVRPYFLFFYCNLWLLFRAMHSSIGIITVAFIPSCKGIKFCFA